VKAKHHSTTDRLSYLRCCFRYNGACAS